MVREMRRTGQRAENVAVASPIVELSSYRCVQCSFVIQDLTIGEDLEKRKIRGGMVLPSPKQIV